MTDKTKTSIIMNLMDSIEKALTGMNKLSNLFKRYISNMDGWVKTITKRISELEYIETDVIDNSDNIQHNYELIYELKDQIEELKQEVNALKLIQIISLKKGNLLKERSEIHKKIS